MGDKTQDIVEKFLRGAKKHASDAIDNIVTVTPGFFTSVYMDGHNVIYDGTFSDSAVCANGAHATQQQIAVALKEIKNAPPINSSGAVSFPGTTPLATMCIKASQTR